MCLFILFQKGLYMSHRTNSSCYSDADADSDADLNHQKSAVNESEA